MKLTSVGDVIATRVLFLAGNESVKVVVKMGKPQPFPDEGYFCPVQITGYGGEAGEEPVTYSVGMDAFQSLQLALNMIAVELKVLDRAYKGHFYWKGDEDGGSGFPRTDGQDDDDDDDEQL